jgi:phosphopantetheinyl transferase
VRSDLAVFGSDDRIRLRIAGWEDQRFDLPDPFFRFVFSSPRERVLSEPWSTPTLPLPQGFHARHLSLEGYPDGFFTASGGIWRRVLAHAVLSRRERKLWLSLETPEPRRLEWLLGRVAAKDAVRQHLKQRYDFLLCPADVEILPDEHGRPVVQAIGGVPIVPIVSLSHAKGVAVAVVGDGSAADGVGIDIEPVGRLDATVSSLAFTPDEQALLSALNVADRDGWPLRLWCAKEAVSKALGQGLVGGPHGVVVESFDADTGSVHVHLAGQMAGQFPAENGDSIAAYTVLDRGLIVATSVHVSSHRKETKHEHTS